MIASTNAKREGQVHVAEQVAGDGFAQRHRNTQRQKFALRIVVVQGPVATIIHQIKGSVAFRNAKITALFDRMKNNRFA